MVNFTSPVCKQVSQRSSAYFKCDWKNAFQKCYNNRAYTKATNFRGSGHWCNSGHYTLTIDYTGSFTTLPATTTLYTADIIVNYPKTDTSATNVAFSVNRSAANWFGSKIVYFYGTTASGSNSNLMGSSSSGQGGLGENNNITITYNFGSGYQNTNFYWYASSFAWAPDLTYIQSDVIGPIGIGVVGTSTTTTTLPATTTSTTSTTIKPVVTLNWPLAASAITNNNIFFNFTATDNEGIGNVQVYLNLTGTWAPSIVNSSGYNGTYQNNENMTVPEKYHGYILWNVLASDTKVSRAWAPANISFQVTSTTTTTTTTVFLNSYKCSTCDATQTSETTCNDGKDNDCNGLIDCRDPNCCLTGINNDNSTGCVGTHWACPTPEDYLSGELCNDTVDNDGDGLIDCADGNDCCDEETYCKTSPHCANYSSISGHADSKTLSNLTLSASRKVLPDKMKDLPSGLNYSSRKKVRDSKRATLSSERFMVFSNTTDALNQIAVEWVHNFTKGDLNLSGIVVEKGFDWVGASNLSAISNGSNVTVFVPKPDGDCNELYECVDFVNPWGLFGCFVGGTNITGSIRVKSTANFCQVSDFKGGVIQNRGYAPPGLTCNCPPNLTDADVTPKKAKNCDTYNFTVNYSDCDNDLPYLIKIRIGDREFDMTAANSSDTTVTDGKIYFYATKLKARSWNVSFFALDHCFIAARGSATGVSGHNPNGNNVTCGFGGSSFIVSPEVSLTLAWNYFSSPVVLDTPTLAGIGVSSSCETLVYWNAIANEFVDSSTIGNNSYWAWCSGSTTASFNGTEVPSFSASINVPLSCSGDRCWAPVPYMSLNKNRPQDVFSDTCTQTNVRLCYFDGSTQTFKCTYSTGASDSGFSTLQPGKGYYMLDPTGGTACSSGTWSPKTWKFYDEDLDDAWDCG
jgi:hypothetical protein